MRIPQARPAVSLAAGGFLVVSASSFGIVTAATSGDPGASGRPAAMRAAVGEAQTAQARTAAVSGATDTKCEAVKPVPTGTPSSPTSTGSSGGTSTSAPPTTPASSSTTASPSAKPTTATPSPSPDPSPSTGSSTSSSASASGGTSTQTASAAAFTRNDGNPPITATLLSVTRADASTGQQLCVSVQRDETSVARGQTAKWNVNVWSKGGNVSKVKITLAASPTSLKPVFSFGCSTEGTNSCSFNTVDSQARQLQAQAHIAKSATSVTSAKLAASASGTNVIPPDPKASMQIAVTAPPRASTSASPSPSGSSSSATSAVGAAGVGTTVPQPNGATAPLPNGATSPLGVGRLPFLNGNGAAAALNPGFNASSLFPTLNPSTGALPSLSGQGSQRTRPVADALPAEASVLGAQYAGLAALALAFVLAVTRLSIRRRHAVRPGSGTPK